MSKFALITSMVCLTLSTILLIAYGGLKKDTYHTWYSTFIWYSLLGSMWILICSALYLLFVSAHGQVSKSKKLYSLTEQFVLLLVTMFIAGVCVVTAFQL